MRYIASFSLFFWFFNGLHLSAYAETPQPKTAKDITRKSPKIKSLIDAKVSKNDDSSFEENEQAKRSIDDEIDKVLLTSQDISKDTKNGKTPQKRDAAKTIVKNEKAVKEKDVKNSVQAENRSIKEASLKEKDSPSKENLSKTNVPSKDTQQKESVSPPSGDEKQKENDEKDDETDIDSHVVVTKGSPQKLPLPRFVSLKSNAVNMHVGPGDQYPVDWRYIKQYLPVEILSEFDHWRQIRDSQGTVGWVHKILLSGKRFVMIQNKVVELYKDVKPESSVMATIEPGVVAKLVECNAHLCCVDIQGIRGWVKREFLFGVYPDETKF